MAGTHRRAGVQSRTTYMKAVDDRRRLSTDRAVSARPVQLGTSGVERSMLGRRRLWLRGRGEQLYDTDTEPLAEADQSNQRHVEPARLDFLDVLEVHARVLGRLIQCPPPRLAVGTDALTQVLGLGDKARRGSIGARRQLLGARGHRGTVANEPHAEHIICCLKS